MTGNPKKSFKPKPKYALKAHATMRLHDKRIEIGFRIPPGMEEHLFRFLLTKPRLRALVKDR